MDEVDVFVDEMSAVFRMIEPWLAEFDRLEEARIVREPKTALREFLARGRDALFVNGSGTLLGQFLNAYRRVAVRLGRDRFVAFAEAIYLEIGCEQLAADAAKDPRAELLWELVVRADRRVQFGPRLAFREPVDRLCGCILRAAAPLNAVLGVESGEQRCDLVRQALHAVVETTCEPYLRALVVLGGLASGRLVVPDERLGSVLHQAKQLLGSLDPRFLALIDADMTRFRNAGSHRLEDQWEYVGDGRVRIQDSKHPAVELAVDDVLVRVQALHQLSGPTFLAVLQLYNMRESWITAGICRELMTSFYHALLGEEAEATLHGDNAAVLWDLVETQTAAHFTPDALTRWRAAPPRSLPGGAHAWSPPGSGGAT